MTKRIAFISCITLMTVASAQASMSTLEVSGQMGIITAPSGFEWTSDWNGHSRVFTTQSIPDPWLPDTDVDEEDGGEITSATASVGANHGYAKTSMPDMEYEAYVEPPPGYAALVQSGASLWRAFHLPEGGEVGFSFDIGLSGESFTDAPGDYANASVAASVTIGIFTGAEGDYNSFDILNTGSYNTNWAVENGSDYGPWVYADKLQAFATLESGDIGFVKVGFGSTVGAYTVPTPSAVLLGTLGLISASWRLRKRKTA